MPSATKDPFAAIVEDLTYAYDGIFSPESVAEVVARAVPELLFVCVHNSGRFAERGIALSEPYPKPLSDNVVRAADVIVTMGCGDACPTFAGKRYDDWPVADPAGQPIEIVRDIRDDVQARVTALLRDVIS